MFGPATLPLPASFAHDHGRPQQASSEPPRPQPSGACQFLMVLPSAKSKMCACQVYHHDRSAPGNACDCGHSACYHMHTFGQKPVDGLLDLKVDLVEMVKRLEDIVTAEREARENDRAEYKRDIRALHEALSPFYRTGEELQKRLTQLEVKTTTAGYEQKRLEDRMNALAQVEDKRDTHGPRAVPALSAPHPHSLLNPHPSSHSTDDALGSTTSDEHSSASSYSRHQTPSEAMHAVTEPESPRSSGILDLTGQPRSTGPLTTMTMPATKLYVMPRKKSLVPQDEPRSSGFLGVSMRDRHHLKSTASRKRQLSITGSPMTSSSITTDLTEQGLDDLPRLKNRRFDGTQSHSHAGSTSRSVQSTMSTPPMSTSTSVLSGRSLPQPLPSPSVGSYINADRIYREGSVDKIQLQTYRKMSAYIGHDGETGMPRAPPGMPMLALDVLANVSAASNGHC